MDYEILRDINLCFGMGDEQGKTEIFLNAGLATMHQGIAETGGSWGRREVEVRTLAQVCSEYVSAGQDVHLLKIDVEGLEPQVLCGMDWKICLPWVLCIESTYPESDIPSHDTWEPMVLAADYQLTFTYGVNRYYVSEEHIDLADHFYRWRISCKFNHYVERRGRFTHEQNSDNESN